MRELDCASMAYDGNAKEVIRITVEIIIEITFFIFCLLVVS